VQLAIDGDLVALGNVLEAVRPRVLRYCRTRLDRQNGPLTSPEDVAQEVLLAVCMALPSYQGNGRHFMAFVDGVTADKVADAHRADARRRDEPVAQVPDSPEPETGPEQRAMQGELRRRIKQLLDVLPDKQREILILRIVVGLSAYETAEAVGSTVGAVRLDQHRALKRLRRTVSNEEVVYGT
jgi:RNA polymerase sigma-70 factor (ECF subfamily)